MKSSRNYRNTQQPHQTTEEQVIFTMGLTANHFARQIYAMLRDYGLTYAQWEVLRILGAEAPNGLTCSELSTGLTASDPDITRLLDRMARQRLVRRRRDTRDRRVVFTEISEEGVTLLRTAMPQIQDRLKALMRHMEPGNIRLLTHLLDEARSASDASSEREQGTVPESIARGGSASTGQMKSA